MSTFSPKSILVIGAGVMGRGIALTCARAGYNTTLYDLNEAALPSAEAYVEKFLSSSVTRGKMTEDEKAASMARLSYTADFADLKGDLVIEAILERLDIKQDLFAKLEAQNGPDTILASNTSTIPITRIAAKLERPDKVVGMHFFNPAPIMKLVEVISGVKTSPEVAAAIFGLAEDLGKKAVMAKDEPGFIVNRVARHFYVESLLMLEEQVADHETLDKLICASGFRMGPFQLMDLIGIETNLSVTKSMYDAFFQDEKFRPSRIQQQKADAGLNGRKSGEGFYKY
ncbi:MAG: 3-hydroxyacyl-CoA dehydrogenase family protein [Bacteroidia bacterium]